jgi:hypothetical protein
MTIFSTRVTVLTDPTLLVPAHFNPQRAKLLNTGAEVVRIGGPDVTLEAFGLNRLPDSPNVSRNVYEFDLYPGEEIWGMVAAGSAIVNVWYQQD